MKFQNAEGAVDKEASSERYDCHFFSYYGGEGGKLLTQEAGHGEAKPLLRPTRHAWHYEDHEVYGPGTAIQKLVLPTPEALERVFGQWELWLREVS